MKEDFKVLNGVQINGKEFIIYFDNYEYNSIIASIYEIYNQYVENYIQNKFKCEMVPDIYSSNPSFYRDENNEVIEFKDKYRYDVEGYYFLFDDKEEMEKCLDHINSIKMICELRE